MTGLWQSGFNMGPFLSNLGIVDTDQARDPTASAFPPAFNINSKPLWDKTLSIMPMTDDPATNWGFAIKLFIENCTASNVYPFSNVRQSATDQVVDALSHARRAVVKFMDISKILHYVSLRATLREAEMNNLGFTLKVMGAATIKDPTFEKWLTQLPAPAFRLKHEGRYLKHLARDVTMVVYSESAQRWHVGYEIMVHGFPDIPGHPLASKYELEKFILDILWLPILKSHRPIGYHTRLI